ncbi:MAG: HSP20 family protein [bacterium]|nr:MAG: HSP20 family protein [bacterium]
MDKSMEKVKVEEPKAVARKSLFAPGFFMTPYNFFNANPFDLIKEFTEEMDKVSENFGFSKFESKEFDWKPAIDIFTRDGKFFIHAELPGMAKEDIKVELEENRLVVRGERKRETKEEKKDFYRSELSYGSFYRAIVLPKEANIGEIEAKFGNGILEICMPVAVKAEDKKKEVPIGDVAAKAEETKTAKA